MRTLFVDTLYWIARSSPKDQWYQRTREVGILIRNTRLVTTEVVLIEFLNYFCSYGSQARVVTVEIVRKIFRNPTVEIVPLTQELFTAGLQLYEARPDKGYSLTDCISMMVMHDRNLTEVLTHDRHFLQEGSKFCFRTGFSTTQTFTVRMRFFWVGYVSIVSEGIL